MQFSGNFWPNNRFLPPPSGLPPVLEILDPPLEMVQDVLAPKCILLWELLIQSSTWNLLMVRRVILSVTPIQTRPPTPKKPGGLDSSLMSKPQVRNFLKNRLKRSNHNTTNVFYCIDSSKFSVVKLKIRMCLMAPPSCWRLVRIIPAKKTDVKSGDVNFKKA